MSAKFHSMKSIKSKIIKNKSSKIFAETITSQFTKKSEKSPKPVKEFIITRSTKFTDDNLTNTLASSIRTISKFRLRKKESPLYLNLDDFHKQILLTKNKDDYKINNLYKQKGYNRYNSNYLSNDNTHKYNILNLKKNFKSIFDTLSKSKSRNIFMNYKYNQKKNYQSNSLISFSKDNSKNNNKNKIDNLKDLSKISKKNYYTITNIYRNNFNNELLKNNFYSNILLSDNNIKTFKSILNSKKHLKYLKNPINLKTDILKTVNINNDINNNINNFNSYNTYINQNTINNIISKNKNGNNFIYIGRNKISTLDKMAYPSFNTYLYSNKRRAENIQQFTSKTKLLALDKYIQKLNKECYNQQFTINDCDFEKQCLDERNIQVMTNLLKSYSKTWDDYLRFLIKKYRDIQEENELLIKDKIRIMTEIERIRQKILKGMTIIKEGYEIKYFLMCVKNHTLIFEKFSKEDIEEIENDKLKLKEGYYSIKRDKSKKDRKSVKKEKHYSLPSSSQIKKVNSFSSNKNINSKKYFLTKEEYVKKRSQKNILTKKKFKHKFYDLIITVDEFFDNLEAVTTKIYNLILEYDNKCAINNYYKLELNNILNDTSDENKNSIYLAKKINEYENNLKILKNKNKKLLEHLNKLKDNKYKNDVKNFLVLINVHKIYSNIKNKFNIRDITKQDLINDGEKLYLKVIEDFFIKLLNKVSENKNKHPEEYEILKKQLEKKKKYDAFISFQRLLMQKLQIKIHNVLKKASKVIYKSQRKTNDYRANYKQFQIIKNVEKKKNDIEIFFEYINNTD